MGRLTASAMHEIQNVLAGVKESAGLMDDLLAMTKEKDCPNRDKFRKVVASILDLVERGVRLSSEVNRLGHASQSEDSPVELTEVARRTIFLAHRITQSRRMRFELAPGDHIQAGLTVLEAMRALFLVMEQLTERLPQCTTVGVRAGDFHGRPALRLGCACSGDTDLTPVPDLVLARRLPGGVDCLLSENEMILTFPAPDAAPAGRAGV
jgi:hypothetical protein